MRIVYLLASISVLSMSIGFSSCADRGYPEIEQQMPDKDNEENEDSLNQNIVNLKIGSHVFTVNLVDNETSRSFKALLPMSVSMMEMNGNEKYNFISSSLPISTYKPSVIQEGDLMLYGYNCVVLFYKTFPNSYSYTRLGKINNTTGLIEAVGASNINVIFEAQN